VKDLKPEIEHQGFFNVSGVRVEETIRDPCDWLLIYGQDRQSLHELKGVLLHPPQREENRFFCTSSCVKGTDGHHLLVSDAVSVVGDETRQLADQRPKALLHAPQKYLTCPWQKGVRSYGSVHNCLLSEQMLSA
jgi:hypothetical protein